MVMAHYNVMSKHDQLALQVVATNIAATLPVGRVEVYSRGGGMLGITIHDVQWPEWCLFHQCTFRTELSQRFVALRLSGAVDRGM